jgi:membrane fusion protein (multidrug efflux system)
VAVAAVERRAVTEHFLSYGTLNHGHEIEIMAEQPGRIVAILYTDGQRVEQGQPLVRLDDRQARAELDTANSRLSSEQRAFDRVAQLARDGFAAASRLDDARNTLQSARAQTETLQRAVDRLTVRAPFAGVVGKHKVEQGAFLGAGQSIVTLRDDSVLQVVFKVPERMIRDIRPGQPLTATSKSSRTPAWKGRWPCWTLRWRWRPAASKSPAR